ncbi:MAG: PorP/SprF family type IX secretion system membrane protein [Marinilabiliaceae bacterium]
MRKWVLLINILLLGFLELSGQKYFITNQYVHDLFLVNPSDAGSNRECITLNGFYQKQWFDMDLAPTTQLLAFQAPLKQDLGAGAYLYNDRNGNFNRQGLQTSLSSKVVLSKARNGERSLHFGLSAMIDQSSVNMDMLSEPGVNDPVITGESNKGVGFNANAGMMFKINSYRFGAAASNIFSQNNPMYNSEWEPDTGPDFHLHAGTSWKVPERELFLSPLLYFRSNQHSDTRLDANLELFMPTLQEGIAFWGILAYRRTMDQQLGENLGLATTVGLDYKSFSFGIEHQLGLTQAQQQFGSALVAVLRYRICTGSRKGAYPCTQEDAMLKFSDRKKDRGLKGVDDPGGK